MVQMSSTQKCLLIAGFLITGSINTVTKKWQFQSCGPSTYDFSPSEKADNMKNCGKEDWKIFKKPWTQNIQMFFGEALVFGVFLARRPGRAREAREVALENGGEVPRQAPFYIFLLPACCDILGTGVGGVGMLFISASVWQMMRGSLMVFAAIWSTIFLGKRLPLYNWIAVGVSSVGLLAIGVSAILDESGSGSSNVPLGILLTVTSQAFAAAQMVVEEIFVKGHGAPPEQVVGSEGLWGIILMIGVLLVMGNIKGSDSGAYENAGESVHMLAGSSQLDIFVFFYLISISFFNFFGVTIAGKLSAVHRTINDAMRTMIIWSVEIFVGYCISEDYGTKWQPHTYMQLLGFALLVLGNLLKSAIIKIPGISYEEDAPKPLTVSTAGVSLMEDNTEQSLGGTDTTRRLTVA